MGGGEADVDEVGEEAIELRNAAEDDVGRGGASLLQTHCIVIVHLPGSHGQRFIDEPEAEVDVLV